MKNLNVANLDGLPREECDKVLLEMVKHLKHCKYASGKEGTVYFVSDKYVVKKYENDAMWVVLNELFEAYCEENKRFADNGYSVPKIYSWLKIPRAHNIFESRYSSSYDYDYDFYVLEERAEGRELYYRHIMSVYELVKNEFSQKKFDKIVHEPVLNLSAYKEVARAYIRDFIAVNQMIESMPENVLENYVLTLKNIFQEGEYSTPDIVAKNIIISPSSLTLIDNHMGRRKDNYYFVDIDAERFVATRILLMFKLNHGFNTLENKLDKLGVYSEFEGLIDDNKVFCAAALEKLYAAMKKVMGNLDKDKVSSVIALNLSNMVGTERAEKVISVLDN